MAKAKVVWDYKAAGELLLKSEGIAAVCEEEAEHMTRATGMEYVADVYTGRNRVNARGYDKTSSEDGSYVKRRNGKAVYTQKKSRSGDD